VDLKELGRVNPDQHWYYQAKSRYLIALNSKYFADARSIIEIGAGSTFFLQEALKFSTVAVGYAVDINYKEEEKSNNIRIFLSKSLPEVSGDVYLFIDVLEHVEEDLKLLVESIKNAKPGSIVIISVPAFQFLWSGHDEFLDHKRRYTTRDLEELARNARLQILDVRYVFGALFPIACLVRLIKKVLNKQGDDLVTLHPFVNTIAKWLFEHFDRINRNRLFGLSATITLQTPSIS